MCSCRQLTLISRFKCQSFCQQSFRKSLWSICKRLWSVCKRVEVSSQTLSTFICVEDSSVQISDVNIWAYKLTLKLSVVVDFARSQRLCVACTIAVICKSIYQYETGLTVVLFYQEALAWPRCNNLTTDITEIECNWRKFRNEHQDFSSQVVLMVLLVLTDGSCVCHSSRSSRGYLGGSCGFLLVLPSIL